MVAPAEGAVAKIQAILDGFGAKLTAAESRIGTVEAKAAEMAAIRADIEALRSLTTARRGIHVPGVDGSKYNLAKALAAVHLANDPRRRYGDPQQVWEKAAPFEREVNAAAWKEFAQRESELQGLGVYRTATLGNDPNLGLLLPVEVMDELIPLLRAKLILQQAGATFVPDLTGGQVMWPKETGEGTGGWVGETQSMTATDTNVGYIELRPHTAYNVTKVGLQQLLAGSQRINNFLRTSLLARLMRIIQSGVLFGTGAQGQPLGVSVRTSGSQAINSKAFSGAPTQVLLDLLTREIAADDGDTGSMHWLMGPRCWWAIADIAAADTTHRVGMPVLALGDMSKGDPKMLRGIPVLTSTSFAENAGAASPATNNIILLGVWERLLIGDWGPIMIDSTTQASTAWLANEAWFKAVQLVDVGVTEPKSFAVGTAVTTGAA